MKAWAILLAGVVGLSLPAREAAAQLPEQGARSLRLSSGGDTRLGVWRMGSGRTSLGLEAGLALARQTQEDAEWTSWALTAAPSFKRYGAPVGPFAPYLFGSLPLGLERTGYDDDSGRSAWTLGGALAAGLDWFPARRASVGAHAGVRVSRQSQSLDDELVERPDSRTTQFGTFGSGLSVHIYF